MAYQIKKAGRQDILDIIRTFEKSLPPGRYLQGFEICDYLKRIGKKSKRNRIKIENPTEQETAMSDRLWQQYEREVLWPGEKFEGEHPEVKGILKHEQIHEWENWVCERLGLPFEPLEVNV